MIIRKATMEERDALQQLIAESARELSREHYSDAQVEAAIATVFGVDTTLIEDGTYFVVESDGELAGCGGWSKRKTLFGGDQYSSRNTANIDPETEPAKIRAFFIHPDHARKGVARAILSRCEDEAREHFSRLGIAGRCRFAAGDFFEAIPGGADTILMKSIIHNWDDDRSGIILRKSRDALPAGGKLIMIERIMPERPAIDAQARECAMSDLNMLRGPGGFERTEMEYLTLAESAGFAFAGTASAGSFSLIQFDKAAD